MKAANQTSTLVGFETGRPVLSAKNSNDAYIVDILTEKYIRNGDSKKINWFLIFAPLALILLLAVVVSIGASALQTLGNRYEFYLSLHKAGWVELATGEFVPIYVANDKAASLEFVEIYGSKDHYDRYSDEYETPAGNLMWLDRTAELARTILLYFETRFRTSRQRKIYGQVLAKEIERMVLVPPQPDDLRKLIEDKFKHKKSA